MKAARRRRLQRLQAADARRYAARVEADTQRTDLELALAVHVTEMRATIDEHFAPPRQESRMSSARREGL